MESLKLCVVVDGDLPYPQVWVQAAHACYEAGKKWRADNPSFVILEAHGEAQINAVCSRAHQDGIEHKAFFEPFYNATTAVALKPMPVLPRWLFSFDLLS